MLRSTLLAAALAIFAVGCTSEVAPTANESVAVTTHPSLRMFDVALSSDAMQLSDVQIVAVTAARAPLVAAIARLEGAREAYAEALAAAIETKKPSESTLMLAAADLDAAIDAYVPVERTAKNRLFETLDPRQRELLGRWPALTPTKVDFAIDRIALADAMIYGVDERARIAAKLRAGGSLR